MQKTYFPLHVHSTYSLLDGLSRPTQIARKCIDDGLPGSAITDHGTISGAMSFIETMIKKGLKPIIGCEMYICEKDASIRDDNKRLQHLVILAKNKEGWRNLIHAVSESNKKENFYSKPRLSLEQLSKFTSSGNLIGFSGHLGSHLSNCIFSDISKLNRSMSLLDVKSVTNSNWVGLCEQQIGEFKNIFGKDNFFTECQLIDSRVNKYSKLLVDGIRFVAKKTKTPCIATPDAHYARREDAVDQRVLLCSAIRTTFNEIRKKIHKGEDFSLSSFFISDNYFIPSYDEMIAYGNTEEELENTLKIADRCEVYDLSAPPRLPKFSCPDGLSSKEYILSLMREGWKQLSPKIQAVITSGKYTKEDYTDRIKKEISVLEDAELFDYFLMVDDFVKFARKSGQLTGAARGSAASSLILYLLRATHVDPIEYGLLFERFYNSARNIPSHVSFGEVPFTKFLGI
jgi:DNA polymerase-3 subunit alpha